MYKIIIYFVDKEIVQHCQVPVQWAVAPSPRKDRREWEILRKCPSTLEGNKLHYCIFTFPQDALPSDGQCL